MSGDIAEETIKTKSSNQQTHAIQDDTTPSLVDAECKNPIYQSIAKHAEEIMQWRRHIHQHPELGFEEHNTAAFVKDKLESWGITVTEGLGKTGLVGTLKAGTSERAIGLRADMDALPIQEKNLFGHRSQNDGTFHGCGHDGHTAMLLGAAHHLSQHPHFDGIVHFIFQPAEEGLGGAVAMIDDGLFDQFPVESVYGMHNWPGLALGEFAIKPGPMMAASTNFDIAIEGKGGHGAFPHIAVDPIIVATTIVQSLQSIVSRNIDPNESGVLSVTQIHSGDTHNVIPQDAHLNGTIRHFEEHIGKTLCNRLREVVEGIALAKGAKATVNIEEIFPTLVNTETETQYAIQAAQSVVGQSHVQTNTPPITGAEDFAFMLQKKPGAYIFVGNGAGEGVCTVHNPNYDFNDATAIYGASYWVELVQQRLPV